MKLIDTSSKTNWKYIGIVMVLGLFVGGGMLFSLQQSDSYLDLTQIVRHTPNSQSSTKDLQSTLESRKGKCSYYGFLDKDVFLNTYVVSKGDTLLSIAKNELGDSSRVDELIELNKTLYPSLSIQNPLITGGQEIMIPPKFFPRSSGILRGVSGEVLEDKDKSILINMRSDQRVQLIGYKTSNTKYLGQNQFKSGDCIFLVSDNSGRTESGILAISPQDKNYFKDLSASEIKTTREGQQKCSYYGYLDKDFFLSKYTVKKGDTIFSVAKNEMGDSSRFIELIQLNKSWYPHLSVENSFIEIGWELRLPPKFISKSSGYLVGLGGEILEETEKSMTINLRYDQAGIKEGYFSYKSPGIKYVGKDSFQMGDCVYAIVDTDASINRILAVSLQDKNYFKEAQGIDMSNWQTYRNDEFGFEFRYPKEWNMIGTNERPVLNDESGKRFMSILFANRAVLGISFCAAYPQDQRCEVLKVGNTQFIIDWGLNGEAVAEIDINADVVMFITLHQKQKRDIFNQILSTFRFVP